MIAKYGEQCFEPLVLLADAVTRDAGGAAPTEVAELLERAWGMATTQGSNTLAERVRIHASLVGIDISPG